MDNKGLGIPVVGLYGFTNEADKLKNLEAQYTGIIFGLSEDAQSNELNNYLKATRNLAVIRPDLIKGYVQKDFVRAIDSILSHWHDENKVSGILGTLADLENAKNKYMFGVNSFDELQGLGMVGDFQGLGFFNSLGSLWSKIKSGVKKVGSTVSTFAKNAVKNVSNVACHLEYSTA